MSTPGDPGPDGAGWGPAPGQGAQPAWGPAPGHDPRSGPDAQPGWGAQPGWAPAPPSAPRPGIVPLRPLGVGELLDGSLQAIRREPRAMLALPAVVGAAYALVVALVTLAFRPPALPAARSGTATSADVTALLRGTGRFVAALLPVSFLFGLAVTAVTATLTVVVARAALGERTTLGHAWRFSRGRVLRVIGLSVVLAVGAVVVLGVGAGVLGGLGFVVATTTGGVPRVVLVVLLVLVALAAAVAFAVVYLGRLGIAPVVVVLDGRFPDERGAGPGLFAAVGRTWRLTRGNLWRTLGVLLLVQLIAGVAAEFIGVPLGLVAGVASAAGGAGTVAGTLVQAIGSLLGLVVTLPFTTAGATLLYLDLRMRREGMDIELAGAAETRGTLPAAPAGGPAPWR